MANKGDAPTLRLHGIASESIVDGPGLRYAVFVQGCPHRCPGCHNPESHDMQGGYVAHAEQLLEAFCENPLLTGLTLSGGEPFAQPAPLLWLAKGVKRMGTTVMAYTGYTLEELQEMARTDAAVCALLDICDILVDGPYVQEQRDLELLWRGSRNQRIWCQKRGIFYKEEAV